MKEIIKDYCSVCKLKKDYLTRGSNYIRYDGVKIVYSLCSECNIAQIKKYREKPKQKQKIQNALYLDKKKNKKHHLARWRLHSAIKKGAITRDPCEVCGEVKTEAHHEDYDKPLDVTWLCRRCHCAFHRKKKEKLN